MLTVNGDNHSLYKRMHAPGDEKRMPVILHREDFEDWLNCSVVDADKYLSQYPAELLVGARPCTMETSRRTAVVEYRT